MAARSAFPAHRYPQGELARAIAAIADAAGGLRPGQRALLERLHANADVATRHTVLPIGEYAALARLPDPGAALANDRYIEEATALGERALRSALDSAGLEPADARPAHRHVGDGRGRAVARRAAHPPPRAAARHQAAAGVRARVRGRRRGAGAAARLPARPGRRHAAALLAVELCSLTWPRTEVTTADLVASALFGDGAAAVVATGEDRGRAALAARLPQVIATRSEVYPDSTDTLGWRLGADGFRIVLTADLAEVVERRLNGSVTAFLGEHGLTVDDIRSWICHPGGPKVLDAAQRALKLPDSALAASRRSLSEAGNMSSVSVLHILELTAAEDPPPPGSFGLMIGLGPGVSAELLLLRW